MPYRLLECLQAREKTRFPVALQDAVLDTQRQKPLSIREHLRMEVAQAVS